jgi:hypothetical protein
MKYLLIVIIALLVAVCTSDAHSAEGRIAVPDPHSDTVEWELAQAGETTTVLATGPSLTIDLPALPFQARARRCPTPETCSGWSDWSSFQWHSGADLNHDGAIGLSDFGALVSQFGGASSTVLCVGPSQ